MLSDRQLSIFKVIIEEFIQTAEPVGSKTLMYKYNLPYSSATIRNDMVELENQGMLEKMHTSSGRVPSIMGYKFYVEHIMINKDEPGVEFEIAQIFDVNFDIQQAIKKSCEVLSKMTSLTTMVLGPDAAKQHLEHIKLFSISERSAVCVFITDTGHTENRVFQFEDDISLNDLQTCTEILNDRLKGTLICEIADKMESLKPILADSIARYETLFKAFLSAFIKFASENVYCSGQNNMLYQPEFADLNRLKAMMSMLEGNQWFNLISSQKESVAVKMNDKTDLVWYDDMAVISSKFRVSDTQQGELFVLGPNRMQYDRVISLMNTMSKTLEKIYRKR